MKTASFNVDVDGNGTLESITIPADVLGPAAKRTYKALEFFAEGQWDKFFVQGSYTWAQSYGNTEGGVKSDIGQDDTGTTQDFDYPELTIGSEGFLPNDRRHSFKVFGNYEINDEWSVGANLLVQSGRPINCIGFLGGSNTSALRERLLLVRRPVRPPCRVTARATTASRSSRGYLGSHRVVAHA